MIRKSSLSKILAAVLVSILVSIFLTSSSLCEGCFTIVVGKDASADGFYTEAKMPSMEVYDERVESPFEADILQAFYTFSNFHNKIDNSYRDKIGRLQAELEEFEKNTLALQKSLEQTALKLYPVDKSKAREMLTNYSNGLYLSAMEAMNRVLSEK